MRGGNNVVLIGALWLLCQFVPANSSGGPPVRAADTLMHNPVLNGDFSGYADLGIPPHHFWQGAKEEQCRTEGGRCFLRLTAGESVRQRVGAYVPTAGQSTLSLSVRGAGRAALLGRDGKGPEVRAKGTGGWEALSLQAGDAPPPYHIELSSVAGETDFASVRLDTALPNSSPDDVADRVLQEATWAVNVYVPLAADDIGPVKTAFDARRYNVVTGERMGTSSGYVCNLDMIPHTLQFLALLTGNPEWKARFIAVADEVLQRNVDSPRLAGRSPRLAGRGNGAIVAWNCVQDTVRSDGRHGYGEIIELLLDAAHVSGDPRFAQGALKVGERVRRFAPRADGGMAWALFADGRRFDAFAYYQDHIYGMGHPVILGRLFSETGDGEFLTLARRAAAWQMATHSFGKWAKPEQVDPWCDDYFGIIVAGFCALHQQTGHADFLKHACEAARQMWPVWPQSLGNGSHTAGDQMRTWDIWCYLAKNGQPQKYLDAVRVACQQALNYRQDVDGVWKDFNTKKFAPWDVQEGSPPLNLLEGIASLYGATKDPTILACYLAVFDSAMKGFKREHGILSRLPSPTAPPKPRQTGVMPEMSFELPRFFRVALRMAAICRNVPLGVGQHGFPLISSPSSEVRAAMRRDRPSPEPAPPDIAAWETYLNTPTFTASVHRGHTVHLTSQAGRFAYVEDASNFQRWKDSVYSVSLSPGAALGWETVYGAAFGENCIGLGPSGAKGSFIWRFELSGVPSTLVLKDTHVPWSTGDVVRLFVSSDGAAWKLQYEDAGKGRAVDWVSADLASAMGGSQILYVKYEFEASTKPRFPHDRRGACLRRVELQGTEKQR